MYLSDTAIFLIFFAVLVVAIALVFFLRKCIPDCRERTRAAKVQNTTKVDKDDIKQRKFDLAFDLESGRSVSLGSEEKEKKKDIAGGLLERLKTVKRPKNVKVKKAKVAEVRENEREGVEERKVEGISKAWYSTTTIQSDVEKGSAEEKDIVEKDGEDSSNDVAYTHVTSALEGISPKQLEHDFDDVALASPQRNDMLDEWQGEKW